MVIFKSKQKKFEGDLKICGKRLYPTESVKYVNDLSRKLNRANAFRSIYFAIFDSYLSYCSLVWTQNCSSIQRIVIF